MQPIGNQMMHAVDRFEFAIHRHHCRFDQHTMLFFGEPLPDHDIDDSGFVFERDKGDAPGRARVLAYGDESRAA